MNEPTCEHPNRVETDIWHTATGRKWQQSGKCAYCPDCRKWTSRTSMFLDGDFFKTDAQARERNVALHEACKAERDAWIQEHYPQHVAGQGAA